MGLKINLSEFQRDKSGYVSEVSVVHPYQKTWEVIPPPPPPPPPTYPPTSGMTVQNKVLPRANQVQLLF